MYGYIYLTTNLVNFKMYIGKHVTSKKKYLGSGSYLQRAIKKYGKENFKLEIIEWCKNNEELNEREKYWIDYVGANLDYNHSTWYNIRSGGDGFSSEDAKRLWTNPEYAKKVKENISKSMTGRKLPELHKKHIGESTKGRKQSEHCKELCRQAHLRENLSDITLEKYRKANEGTKNPQCVLDENIVLSVAEDHKKGMKPKDIYKKYNQFNMATIRNIIYGRNWSWLTKIEPNTSNKKEKR